MPSGAPGNGCSRLVLAMFNCTLTASPCRALNTPLILQSSSATMTASDRLGHSDFCHIAIAAVWSFSALRPRGLEFCTSSEQNIKLMKNAPCLLEPVSKGLRTAAAESICHTGFTWYIFAASSRINHSIPAKLSLQMCSDRSLFLWQIPTRQI